MKNNFTRLICGFSILFFTQFTIQSQPIVAYNSFISSGLSSPIEIVNAGDGSGRLFIAEQGGAIKVWVPGSGLLGTPFLTIPSSTVLSGGERGLLSLAFHPDFETNGFFYVYYTRNPDGAITIARYHADPLSNTADPGGTELLVILHPGQANHNGGHLQFRIEGGINYLYFATGDGGGANDPPNNAQNDASMLGKMIRMNVDLPLPISPEIYAKGLRNPFRWSFDRLNGNMWLGDVGQGLKEEVNFWPATNGSGANYGWRCFEGTVQNTNVTLCDPPGKIAPVFEYDNPNPGSSAVTGGYVYRGGNPALYGYYVVTDFYSGELWILNPDGTVARNQTNLASNIAAYGEDEAGELYAASLTGNIIYSITASGSSALPITLINFSAKQFAGYNEIRWVTSFEQNADRYVIEYSRDGFTFSEAGNVMARNSSTGDSYMFRHNTNNAGKTFYRLQMKDLDGSSRYSSVVVVGDNSKNVRIYSSVLRSHNLELTGNIPLDKLSVYNTNGVEVYTNTLNGTQGYISIQLPPLVKGMYFVRLQGENMVKTERILIP
jgi:glucose/arabinose dehydrogenase